MDNKNSHDFESKNLKSNEAFFENLFGIWNHQNALLVLR